MNLRPSDRVISLFCKRRSLVHGHYRRRTDGFQIGANVVLITAYVMSVHRMMIRTKRNCRAFTRPRPWSSGCCQGFDANARGSSCRSRRATECSYGKWIDGCSSDCKSCHRHKGDCVTAFASPEAWRATTWAGHSFGYRLAGRLQEYRGGRHRRSSWSMTAVLRHKNGCWCSRPKNNCDIFPPVFHFHTVFFGQR